MKPAADNATELPTPPPTLPIWQLLLASGGVLLYGWASHWVMVHAGNAPWAVFAMFGPLLLALATAGLAQRHTPTLLLCAGVLAVLAVVVWRGGVDDINRLYVMQHAGIHASLAWAFASTLRPGAKPLISALAERVHTQFTPAMRQYTRQVTGSWVLYFAGMGLLSVALYVWAPWPWWSLFGNVITPVAVAVFFVGEHLLRYRWHPEFERLSLRGAIQAWRSHQAQSRLQGQP